MAFEENEKPKGESVVKPVISTGLAASHARTFGLAPQEASESGSEFRDRISGQLRDMGRIIEAHEAWQGKYYDEGTEVISALIGNLAQQMQGVNYNVKDGPGVGMDIAAGMLIDGRKESNLPDFLMKLLTQDPEATLNLLTALGQDQSREPPPTPVASE